MSEYVVVSLPAVHQFLIRVSDDGSVTIVQAANMPSLACPLDSRYAESVNDYYDIPRGDGYELAADIATAWLDTNEWPTMPLVYDGVTIPDLNDLELTTGEDD